MAIYETPEGKRIVAVRIEPVMWDGFSFSANPFSEMTDWIREAVRAGELIAHNPDQFFGLDKTVRWRICSEVTPHKAGTYLALVQEGLRQRVRRCFIDEMKCKLVTSDEATA